MRKHSKEVEIGWMEDCGSGKVAVEYVSSYQSIALFPARRSNLTFCFNIQV